MHVCMCVSVKTSLLRDSHQPSFGHGSRINYFDLQIHPMKSEVPFFPKAAQLRKHVLTLRGLPRPRLTSQAVT